MFIFLPINSQHKEYKSTLIKWESLTKTGWFLPINFINLKYKVMMFPIVIKDWMLNKKALTFSLSLTKFQIDFLF